MVRKEISKDTEKDSSHQIEHGLPFLFEAGLELQDVRDDLSYVLAVDGDARAR